MKTTTHRLTSRSPIRQFANSPIRQFANSTIRQFSHSVIFTLAFLSAFLAVAAPEDYYQPVNGYVGSALGIAVVQIDGVVVDAFTIDEEGHLVSNGILDEDWAGDAVYETAMAALEAALKNEVRVQAIARNLDQHFVKGISYDSTTGELTWKTGSGESKGGSPQSAKVTDTYSVLMTSDGLCDLLKNGAKTGDNWYGGIVDKTSIACNEDGSFGIMGWKECQPTGKSLAASLVKPGDESNFHVLARDGFGGVHYLPVGQISGLSGSVTNDDVSITLNASGEQSLVGFDEALVLSGDGEPHIALTRGESLEWESLADLSDPATLELNDQGLLSVRLDHDLGLTDAEGEGIGIKVDIDSPLGFAEDDGSLTLACNANSFRSEEGELALNVSGDGVYGVAGNGSFVKIQIAAGGPVSSADGHSIDEIVTGTLTNLCVKGAAENGGKLLQSGGAGDNKWIDSGDSVVITSDALEIRGFRGADKRYVPAKNQEGDLSWKFPVRVVGKDEAEGEGDVIRFESEDDSNVKFSVSSDSYGVITVKVGVYYK